MRIRYGYNLKNMYVIEKINYKKPKGRKSSTFDILLLFKNILNIS